MPRILAIALVLVAACDRPPIERETTTTWDAAESDQQPDSSAGSVCGDAPPLGAQQLTTDPSVAIILGDLSLAEKVEQMAGLPIGDMFQTPDNERVDIRGFRFRDGPRGVRLERGTATCFPVAVARGATWDLDLERRIGAAIGAETRGLGHNIHLAPTINTLRHPGWGRGQETYGEDPWFLGMMGIASVEGIQSQVPACVKHLAGNNLEDSRMTNNAIIEEQTLRENYARQFEMVVKEADVACVMAAYNQVNGDYCCENAPLLRDLLKGEWAFHGFVVSDWFATKTTVESALAGLDVEMPWRNFYDRLQLAVRNGQVTEDIIDQAVERILRIKFRYGFALLSEPFEGDPSVVESDEHIALALEAAHKGIVLLKNDDDVLPLNRAALSRIAVVGPWATQARLGDNGSSDVTPSYAITPFDGIDAGAGAGIEVVTSEDASAADGADVVIVVVALTQSEEGEAVFQGGDRVDLDISDDQEQLIIDASAAATITVVVMEAGGPLTMERWMDHADAIVMAWYPGMEGGRAIADILFGDAEPSGRVVQTWPRRLEDEPEFGNQQNETVFDYYHGYRHFDHNDIEPLFPFGYGLTYTEFEYSNLVIPCETVTTAGRLVVSVDIENTGSRAGVAVPQLYVSYPETEARRPEKELKGFARVTLEPGETQTVEIPVRVPDLAYWDAASHAWVVERAEHLVHVGPNAGNLPLSGSFWVGDTGIPSAEAGTL